MQELDERGRVGVRHPGEIEQHRAGLQRVLERRAQLGFARDVELAVQTHDGGLAAGPHAVFLKGAKSAPSDHESPPGPSGPASRTGFSDLATDTDPQPADRPAAPSSTTEIVRIATSSWMSPSPSIER